jgi:hypothetical protein
MNSEEYKYIFVWCNLKSKNVFYSAVKFFNNCKDASVYLIENMAKNITVDPTSEVFNSTEYAIYLKTQGFRNISIIPDITFYNILKRVEDKRHYDTLVVMDKVDLYKEHVLDLMAQIAIPIMLLIRDYQKKLGSWSLIDIDKFQYTINIKKKQNWININSII